MAWSLTETEDGRWYWEIFQSAYGLTMGHEGSFPEALVQLAIAQGNLLEEPLPPSEVALMTADPDRYLALASGLATFIGENIFPIDEDSLRGLLASLQ